MAFEDDLQGDGYQRLMNQSPLSAPASSTLGGMSQYLDNFRSQSRLGMVDMNIINQRRGVQTPGEPGIPSLPSAPGPQGIKYSDEYLAKKAAEKEIQGSAGPTKKPAGEIPVVKNPPTSGTFMPLGSSQQQIAELATQKLNQMQQMRQMGMV